MTTPALNDDLVRRLKEDADYIENYESFVGSPDRIVRTMTDAATALEALAAENAELRSAASSLSTILDDVERIWPGSFWHLAKGRVRSAEPLFGFQVLFGTDEIIAEGEGECAASAVLAAIARTALTGAK